MAATLAAKDYSQYFSDLGADTAAYNAYIDYLVKKGIIDVGDGKYRPNDALSRGELQGMLGAIYKEEDGESRQETTNTDRAVTREETALWILRGELQRGMPKELVQEDLSAFSDAASIAKEARKAVSLVTRMGIMSEKEKGIFDPKGTITRAEIAPVLYRLVNRPGPGGQGGRGVPPGGPGGPGGPSGGAPSGGPDGASKAGQWSFGNSAKGGFDSPGGPPPGAPKDSPFGGPGNDKVDHGTYAAKATEDVKGAVYSSKGDQENALRVEDGAVVTLKDIRVKKTGGEAGSGDSSNFYGANAALLAMDKAKVSILGSVVESNARGGNGIFAYGEGTKVKVSNSSIRTTEGSSGGLMVAGGGAMEVENCQVETNGGSSAAIRTDRGGGTVRVSGGSYTAHGAGSPAIYCTADIAVKGATLTATGSEAIVVEGKNSVSLADCSVSGNMAKADVENIQNIMIYQSMSGDAERGKASFSMVGGSLKSLSGDLFYITNTACTVTLSKVDITYSEGYLLEVAGNDARRGWGVVGKNGGQCVFTAENQELKGSVRVDAISTLSLSLTKGASFTGTIDEKGEGGTVDLVMDDSSSWKLSADAHISSFEGSKRGIDTNGHTLYVAGKVYLR